MLHIGGGTHLVLSLPVYYLFKFVGVKSMDPNEFYYYPSLVKEILHFSLKINHACKILPIVLRSDVTPLFRSSFQRQGVYSTSIS